MAKRVSTSITRLLLGYIALSCGVCAQVTSHDLNPFDPGKSNSKPPVGTVSMAELRHKIPTKANKEAIAADKALKKHNLAEYIAHLQKAIAIDPEFIAGRRNLALAYLSLRQYHNGIQAVHELFQFEPRSVLGYCALSAAYLDLQKFQDSEAAARNALDIDSANEMAHFLLGASLAEQDKDYQSALYHLGKASEHFPYSHVAAAAIYRRQGRKEEARSQLEAYLESGDENVRTAVEDLLSQLY